MGVQTTSEDGGQGVLREPLAGRQRAFHDGTPQGDVDGLTGALQVLLAPPNVLNGGCPGLRALRVGRASLLVGLGRAPGFTRHRMNTCIQMFRVGGDRCQRPSRVRGRGLPPGCFWALLVASLSSGVDMARMAAGVPAVYTRGLGVGPGPRLSTREKQGREPRPAPAPMGSEAYGSIYMYTDISSSATIPAIRWG